MTTPKSFQEYVSSKVLIGFFFFKKKKKKKKTFTNKD